jgi:phosphatidylserine/phosphatidylglycerophosphate/cardiolipin synthase-like enzyme
VRWLVPGSSEKFADAGCAARRFLASGAQTRRHDTEQSTGIEHALRTVNPTLVSPGSLWSKLVQLATVRRMRSAEAGMQIEMARAQLAHRAQRVARMTDLQHEAREARAAALTRRDAPTTETPEHARCEVQPRRRCSMRTTAPRRAGFGFLAPAPAPCMIARCRSDRRPSEEAATMPRRSEPGLVDLAGPARSVALELISGRGHYERVIRAVLGAHTSVWIATANVKELMVEDGRAAPGRRRTLRRTGYVSVLAGLAALAARGVELRLLHAELPSRPFREALADHPRLVAGELALRRCPRVHLKAVIVDGELLYLGSANWTGAGLGAKGSGRRNFELGIVTDDALLLDQVQSIYERIWTGGECEGCRLRDVCPGPLAELARESSEIRTARPRRRKPAQG